MNDEDVGGDQSSCGVNGYSADDCDEVFKLVNKELITEYNSFKTVPVSGAIDQLHLCRLCTGDAMRTIILNNRSHYDVMHRDKSFIYRNASQVQLYPPYNLIFVTVQYPRQVQYRGRTRERRCREYFFPKIGCGQVPCNMRGH